MARTLYLLRHASALPAASGDIDFDRALSEEGLAQCARLADHVHDIRFDKIFCSPAQRTQETFRNVVKSDAVELREEFYNAAAATLLRSIQSTEEAYEHVLVIAHNPGISDLARALGMSIARTFPPGAFASFTVDGSWQDAGPETCKPLDLYCP
jgi:phosphohistidine phosphatase